MGDRRLTIVSQQSMHFYSPPNVDNERLPSETLNLSILKLDSSSFHVQVSNAATVAELKHAVEEVFRHVPQKGPGKIIWPLVWRQFCLCYEGDKLVTETDFIRGYGIKDGDQLHFVYHVSETCSFQRMQSKKRVANLKQQRRYLHKGHKEDDDIGLDDIVIENAKIQHCDAEENRGGKNWLTDFWGGLFSHSQLAVRRRAKIESRICCSMIVRCIVISFRKIRRILRYFRRQHFSRRPTCREC